MNIERVAIGIHGYNVDNYEETVGKLRDPLEALGYFVEFLNYGYEPVTWKITKRNPSIAERLAKRVKYWQDKGCIVDVFAHSNGCAIGHIATEEYGMSVNTFVAIHPALKADLNPCRTANLVQVWYNDGDKAVVLSKWLRWLNPWARNARPWGEQGRIGYKGLDKNVTGFDSGMDFKEHAYGHSDEFNTEKTEFFMLTIPLYCFKEKVNA